MRLSKLAIVFRNRQATAETRLRIFNVTRQTEIATCAETADRGANRRKGLLGRDGLAPGEGLWIVPCEAVHTFGMRFAIDLIYLDRKHRIVKTRSNVKPSRLSACFSAHSILELPSGVVCATQAMPGDMLEFESYRWNQNSSYAAPNDKSSNLSLSV